MDLNEMKEGKPDPRPMHIVKVISGHSGFLVHRFHRSLYSQSPLPAPSVSDGGHNAPIRTSNLEGWCVWGGGGGVYPT